jgi:hypothetical protein
LCVSAGVPSRYASTRPKCSTRTAAQPPIHAPSVTQRITHAGGLPVTSRRSGIARLPGGVPPGAEPGRGARPGPRERCGPDRTYVGADVDGTGRHAAPVPRDTRARVLGRGGGPRCRRDGRRGRAPPCTG